MAVNAEIQVYGVKAALKELGEIDKKQRFKAVNKVKSAAKPMIEEARKRYPETSDIQGAMSGWSTKGRLGYDKPKVDKGVVVQVGGRSRGDSYAIVTLIQKDPGGALYDIAGFANGAQGKGEAQGDQFIENLNRGFGKAQRGMWRSVTVIRQLADKAITEALQEVMAEVNRKLVR